jgi:CheY-like chemotaxis protein
MRFSGLEQLIATQSRNVEPERPERRALAPQDRSQGHIHLPNQIDEFQPGRRGFQVFDHPVNGVPIPRRIAGYALIHVDNGASGLETARGGGFNLLIADRMLPERDGLSIIATLRAENDRTPVLVLSALSEVDERVRGFKPEATII